MSHKKRTRLVWVARNRSLSSSYTDHRRADTARTE